MFNILKGRDASLAQLTEQLSGTQGAHAQAAAAVARAQDAFDEDGSPAASKRLIAARESEAMAADHVARAERLLAAAQKRLADDRRAELETRAEELHAKLAAARALRAGGVQAEAEALMNAVKAYGQRVAIERRISGVGQELQQVTSELYGEQGMIRNEHAVAAPYVHASAELLAAMPLPSDMGPEWRYQEGLVRALRSVRV